MDKSKQQWQSELTVHTFNMGDVEDPDLWAAQSLYEFEQSEKGKWVMKNSVPTPSWYRIPSHYGWTYEIRAYLSPNQVTYYKLKYE